MVNALVISKNIRFVQKLLDEINTMDLDINLGMIATSKTEALRILKSSSYGIIFLDSKLIQNFDEKFFDAHRKVLVPLVSDECNLILINGITLDRINFIIQSRDLEQRKMKIVNELEYIGYKFKYKGTHYLVDTIIQMYQNQNNMIDNLQTEIYPVIAEKYHKTVFNVKSSITKATECMYYECDSQKLAKYFHFSEDIKPTVKQVVFAIINKL